MKENENNFESLRRLLALKRHEVPPPGYFEGFSGEVRARLRSGEGSRAVSFSERMGEDLPWLLRLVSAFEAKPAFAGAFASALCLLLLAGIFYAEQPDVALQPLLPAVSGTGPLAMAPSASSLPASQPDFYSTTNPVLNTQFASSQLPGTFFGSAGPAVQPVSFTLPGN